MTDTTAAVRALDPLPYHREIVRLLREHEPQAWDWAASLGAQEEHVQDMRADLLRATYRLDTQTHADVHAAAASAMAALGINAPVTLYQANDGAMNASLFYLPGEVHLVFYGPILERLSPAETLAMLGHELAHYRLWSVDDGAYHIASRILDQAMSYPGAAASHVETARLFSLTTEVFADRGGAAVAGDAGAAITTLVKVQTGLASVDAAAYLAQAAEIVANGGASKGISHPEAFVRAQALDKWWRGDADTDAWIAARLAGPMSMNALDLPGQHRLQAMTRQFLGKFAGADGVEHDGVVTQIKAYFPDWSPGEAETPALDPAEASIDDSVREYLVAVGLDMAMADDDARDTILLTLGRRALTFGAKDLFAQSLRRDLKMPKRGVDALVARMVAA